MGYVIAGIIVLLIVAVAIAWLVMSATGQRRRAGERAAEDRGYGSGLPGSDTAIVAADESPMGDTSEHAGEQSESGETVSDPESAERGIDPSGADRPAEGGDGPRRPERPEDRQMRDAGAPQPQSERLADRPR
jgi:hypothetical protein